MASNRAAHLPEDLRKHVLAQVGQYRFWKHDDSVKHDNFGVVYSGEDADGKTVLVKCIEVDENLPNGGAHFRRMLLDRELHLSSKIKHQLLLSILFSEVRMFLYFHTH